MNPIQNFFMVIIDHSFNLKNKNMNALLRIEIVIVISVIVFEEVCVLSLSLKIVFYSSFSEKLTCGASEPNILLDGL
jgi:hypothetical protein